MLHMQKLLPNVSCLYECYSNRKIGTVDDTGENWQLLYLWFLASTKEFMQSGWHVCVCLSGTVAWVHALRENWKRVKFGTKYIDP